MRILFCLLTISLSACSMVQSKPNQLVIERKWARSTLNEEYLGGRLIHRFAPILTEKLIITGNSIDGVVAYDRANGNERWRLNIHGGCEGGAFIADDILYFGAGDGQLYAVYPDSGRVLWTYPLKAEGLARPLVYGGVLYVLGGNNVAHALNAKSGKLLWLYNRREAGNLSVRGGSMPALYGDLVLIGFSDGSLVGLNKSSGSLVWETNLNRNKRFRDVDASPVIDGDTAYVSSYDGSLYAVNAADGKVVWNLDDGGYDEVLREGGTLYYSSSSGKTMAVEKATGKVIWQKDNPLGIATSPTLFKGVLMVGEMDGALRFLDPRTGDFLGEFAPGRGVTSRVTVDTKSSEVYFMSTDANLFALQVNWKRYAKDWPWQ
ncbi:MAG: PQQ-binding-like beta-propeller repeat protein [Bdellovibrionales bacterium]|nr:PQQ-binding-like beta-propeller repeat protein [Bdellovibrionales bacterium]